MPVSSFTQLPNSQARIYLFFLASFSVDIISTDLDYTEGEMKGKIVHEDMLINQNGNGLK